jgi:hypothetical protein
VPLNSNVMQSRQAAIFLQFFDRITDSLWFGVSLQRLGESERPPKTPQTRWLEAGTDEGKPSSISTPGETGHSYGRGQTKCRSTTRNTCRHPQTSQTEVRCMT